MSTFTYNTNAPSISGADVSNLLSDVKGTTFAEIVYVTNVKTAAAHKAERVQKLTVANVQLFNNLKEFTNAYSLAVKRSANKIEANDTNAVDNFTTQGNYFEHTACYSVVEHKTSRKQYLFAIFNNANSEYYHNGEVVSKESIATMLTPSEREKLLNATNEVRNVANNITHSVHVRTIALENIIGIKAKGNTLTAV